MVEKEVISKVEESAYKLAILISKLHENKNYMEFITEDMQWDSLYLCDYETALAKLSNVLSGMVVTALEDKYYKRDIEQLRKEVQYYDEINKNKNTNNE